MSKQCDDVALAAKHVNVLGRSVVHQSACWLHLGRSLGTLSACESVRVLLGISEWR